MKIRFYIDPKTSMPHIHRHGVREDEAEDVLSNPGEDRPGERGFEDRHRANLGRALSTSHLCARPRSRERFRYYRLGIEGKAFGRLPKATPQEKRMMKTNKFPPGWDEERVQRVLEHYEAQSEEEAVAEDEAAYEDSSQTFMEIPNTLVPKVRELIAKHTR